MYLLRGTALSRTHLRQAALLIGLTLSGLLLCYSLALGRGNLGPATLDYLYGVETASGDSYRWSPPEVRVFVPLELTAPAVAVTQRLTAGPDAAATRALSIASAGASTRFSVAGGTPARVYRYLLPTDGHTLTADYAIAPLVTPAGGEQCRLGLVVYEAPASTFRALGSSAWPAAPLLALALVPPLTLIVFRLWGVTRSRHLLLGAGLLLVLVAGIYALSPVAILTPSLALARGLLVLVLCGAGAQLALRRYRPTGLLLALCIAAVAVPLVYVANGLWFNIGMQWFDQRPALVALLLTPLAAGLATTHPRARAYAPLATWVATASVCAFGAWNLWDELVARPYDFTIYWEAARRLQGGGALYDVALMTREPFADLYKYHPAFMLLMLPLARLPLETAALIWKLANLAAMVAGGIIFLRVYRPRGALPALALAVLLLNLSPITQSLRLGQVDGIFLLGVALAAAGPGARSPWAAGALWSLMGVIKIYPGALALVDLRRHGWRLVAAGALGLALTVGLALAVVGWEHERTFWLEVVPSLGARATRLSNQSLYGLLGRTLAPESISHGSQATDIPLASALHALLAAGVLGLTGWAVWRQQGRQPGLEARAGAVSALVCAVLLAIPVSWDHYQALVLLPLLGAALAALRDGARAPWLLGAYTLLAFGTYKHVQNGLIASEVVLLLASYRTIGLLLLWGWWVRQIWDEGGQ